MDVFHVDDEKHYWVVKSLAKVLFAQGVYSLGKPEHAFNFFCSNLGSFGWHLADNPCSHKSVNAG